VKYTPIEMGDHVVSINLKGQPIQGSPRTVRIDLPLNMGDATQCVAYGPGLESAVSGETAEFTVEVRNRTGQKINEGGAPIDVFVSWEADGSELSGNDLRIEDNHDGTFKVFYEPKESGHYIVEVVLRNKLQLLYYNHIKSSPFRVPVKAGTDASQTVAFGPGVGDNGPIEDTRPTTFTIQAKDKNGNDMKKGGDDFQVVIDGPKGKIPADIKDNEDGTYTVNYKPNDPGKHKVDVSLKSQPIKGNPFSVNVKEGADEAHSCIESYSFIVRAKTKRGENKKDGGDNFKVQITGPAGEQVIQPKDNGDGSYTCNYKLSGSGKHTIAVTLNDKHIKGSPWTQSVA